MMCSPGWTVMPVSTHDWSPETLTSCSRRRLPVGRDAVGVADWPAVDGFALAAWGALSLRSNWAFVVAGAAMARPAGADRHATQIKAPLIQFSLMGVFPCGY